MNVIMINKVDLANIRVQNWCLNLFLILFMLQVAVLAELMLSSRITNVLMMMYLPFLGFAILAILRGLLPCSRQNKMNAESLHWVGKRRLEMQHATKIWYNCLAFAELLMPVSMYVMQC